MTQASTPEILRHIKLQNLLDGVVIRASAIQLVDVYFRFRIMHDLEVALTDVLFDTQQ